MLTKEFYLHYRWGSETSRTGQERSEKQATFLAFVREPYLKVIFDKEIADRLADKWERALGSSRGIMVKTIVADVTRVLKTMGRME